MADEYQIQNEFELQEFSRGLAAKICAGQSLGLIGQLGAGKTSFTRCLMKELGYTGEIASPSYVLQHLYQIPDGLCVEHWDLYRLQTVPEELLECVAPDRIRVIEWIDKFPRLMTDVECTIEIDFSESDTARVLRVYPPGYLST